MIDGILALLIGIMIGLIAIFVGYRIGLGTKERQTYEEHCTTCKEYDKKNHCCHRWTDNIRRSLDELKEYYAFNPIEVKPDEDGDYVLQYSDGKIKIRHFDADQDRFGDWCVTFCPWESEEEKRESKEFVSYDRDAVAWARLPKDISLK